jgi:hypothetical protein
VGFSSSALFKRNAIMMIDFLRSKRSANSSSSNLPGLSVAILHHDDLHGVDCTPYPSLNFGGRPRSVVGRPVFSQTTPSTRRPHLDRVSISPWRGLQRLFPWSSRPSSRNPALNRRGALSLVFLRVRQSRIVKSGNDKSETDHTVFVLDKHGRKVLVDSGRRCIGSSAP